MRSGTKNKNVIKKAKVFDLDPVSLIEISILKMKYINYF